MSYGQLPHTFSLHGIVVALAATGSSDEEHPAQLVTVAVGADRAIVTVPAALWDRDGAAVVIGGRLHARGRTDYGPVAPGSRNVAELLEVPVSGGDMRHH